MDLERAKEILGITGELTVSAVKAAFRTLAKVFHPDVIGGSVEKMAELVEAYKYLMQYIFDAAKGVVDAGTNLLPALPDKGGEFMPPVPVKEGPVTIPIPGGSIAEVGIDVVKAGGKAIATVLGGMIAIASPIGKDIIAIIEKKLEEKFGDDDGDTIVDEPERPTKEPTEPKKPKYPKFDPNDMLSILEALEECEDFRILKKVNPKFLNDEFFMQAAINITPECIYYASKELKSNKDFMISVFIENPEILMFADKSLKDDKEFVMDALDIYPCAVLEYCNRKFWADKDVMLKAVSIDGLTYKYASNKLKADREIVDAALMQNFTVFSLINEYVKNKTNLYSDETFVLAAIRNKADEILEKCDKSFFNNKEFVLKIVRFDGINLKYASNELKADKEIVELALSSNLDAYKYAAPSFDFSDHWLREIAHKYGIGTNEPLMKGKRYLEICIEEFGFTAWEKACKVSDYNPHIHDIDIIISLLRQSSPEQAAQIKEELHRYGHGRLYITVNGKYDARYGTPRDIEALFKFEFALTCKNYGNRDTNNKLHSYNDAQMDYIIKRAKAMKNLDYEILEYFSKQKRNDPKYFYKIACDFGTGAVNYYTGEDAIALVVRVIRHNGVESIADLDTKYTSDLNLIVLLINYFGEDVIKYATLSYEDLMKLKEEMKNMKTVDVDEIEEKEGKKK